VLAPHYSLLLKVDPDNYPKLKPDVAEAWSVSADGLTYTFKIDVPSSSNHRRW
jgi:peptide/nickel transport system substrate-binding protein